MIDVLIVDDSKADRVIIERAFKRAGSKLRISFCTSGKDALDFLANKPPYESANRPSACILDFKMPGMSGLDLLGVIKQDPKLRTMPVIMLSGSNNKEDVRACYEAGANGYIQKPQSISAFNKLSTSLSVWLGELMQYPDF